MTFLDCDDVPMHVELRHGDRRLPLEFKYDSEEHAYVAFLPDGAGAVWFAAELTADLAR
jgi:hypothetical protein